MKRIDAMAKMDEENIAIQIIVFLREHNLAEKICSRGEAQMDAVYGLAQFLGEEVPE